MGLKLGHDPFVEEEIIFSPAHSKLCEDLSVPFLKLPILKKRNISLKAEEDIIYLTYVNNYKVKEVFTLKRGR